MQNRCSARLIFPTGAENGTRTRDPDLGKVVLYQLSYFRLFLRKSRESWLRWAAKACFRSTCTRLPHFWGFHLSFPESGCKGTAFFWIDQIIWQKNSKKVHFSAFLPKKQAQSTLFRPKISARKPFFAPDANEIIPDRRVIDKWWRGTCRHPGCRTNSGPSRSYKCKFPQPCSRSHTKSSTTRHHHEYR